MYSMKTWLKSNKINKKNTYTHKIDFWKIRIKKKTVFTFDFETVMGFVTYQLF